ncbi:MAG: hypothetical protein JWP29_5468 [Rhodoferax sp.]|nr:hypothetical protein [Rhodoferax sp.]
MRLSTIALSLPALLISVGQVHATEGGGSTFPTGAENYLVAAVPPPGFYFLFYGNAYSADELRNNNGDAIPIPGFKVKVTAAIVRLIWSTPQQFMGGNLAYHVVLPAVDLKVSAAGASQHKTGLGDIILGPALAHHFSPQLHSVLGLDFVLPTGGYHQADLANIGRNTVSVQPLYGVTYVNPTGFNGDIRLTLNFSRKNGATQYRSGNEAFIDYAAGYGLGNGWTVGLGGYARQQFSDDRLNGAALADTRARAFAVGPSVRYDNGKGWFITAKLQQETAVRNATQGRAFWLKTIIPF